MDSDVSLSAPRAAYNHNNRKTWLRGCLRVYSERMLRTRVKKWDIMKNCRKSEALTILRKIREAERQGESNLVVELRGKRYSRADLPSLLRKKLQVGKTLDNVATPTPSQAPSPLGLISRSISTPL